MLTCHLRRAVRSLAPALSLGIAGLTVACADGPTAPAPAQSRTAGRAEPSAAAARSGTPSALLSRTTVGDTTVTTFVLGTDGRQVNLYLDDTKQSDVYFPYGLHSVCDPGTSSYGPGTWDQPCQAATREITITAKIWTDSATGKTATDFEPALRFVPGLRWPVELYLKAQNYRSGDRILYCSGAGCVDEAAADPSLSTNYQASKGWVYREIKHFSGYIITTSRR